MLIIYEIIIDVSHVSYEMKKAQINNYKFCFFPPLAHTYTHIAMAIFSLKMQNAKCRLVVNVKAYFDLYVNFVLLFFFFSFGAVERIVNNFN